MGRGSSGKGNANGGTGGGDWKSDYNTMLSEAKSLRAQADALTVEVNAARQRYYAAPTGRSKAAKAENQRLYDEWGDLSHRRDVMVATALQYESMADGLRQENDPRYRRQRENRERRAIRR